MSTINNRLIPHPVLVPNGVDYNESCEFSLILKRVHRTPDGKISMDLIYNLTSPTLMDMISRHEARFISVIECPGTYYRDSHSTTRQTDLWELPAADYASKVSITPYIVTTSAITQFRAKEHSEEINLLIPKGINLPTGSILAIGNQLEIEIDDIGTVGSAINLTRNSRVPEGQYIINTESELINIEVNPKTHQQLADLRRSDENILWPSLYLSAVEQAIRDLENGNNCRWARALRNTLDQYGIEYEDHSKLAQNSSMYAQIITGSPLNRILTVQPDVEPDND